MRDTQDKTDEIKEESTKAKADEKIADASGKDASYKASEKKSE